MIPAEALVARSDAGARILTLRGLLIRCASAAAGLVLLALVAPAEYGLLAVVQAAALTVERFVDLGLTLPFLSQREEPTREQYAALAGAQLLLILAVNAVMWLSPDASSIFGVLDPGWRPWMLATVAAMITVPLGVGARIRLERHFRYGRIAVIETSAVLLHIAVLLGFTVAGRFGPGVFVAQIVTTAVLNACYYVSYSGPLATGQPRLVFRCLRSAGGFSIAYLVGVARGQATPLVVAATLGLPVAGIWAFASRLTGLIGFSYEGFGRVAIPAAARLTHDVASLRRLIASSIGGAVSLALPAAAITCVSLPIVAIVWPRWAEAVPLAQVYVMCATLSGVAAAALLPVAIVRRGWPTMVAASLVPMTVSWMGLLLLRWLDRDDLWIVVVSTEASAVAILVAITGGEVRPEWSTECTRATASMMTGLAVYGICQLLGLHPVATAILAGAGVSAWVRPRQYLDRAR